MVGRVILIFDSNGYRKLHIHDPPNDWASETEVNDII